MDAKFKNDTTLTRQGDNYQYIIAFECCINGKEGDVIYIEQRGDVASNDTSSEIKHHSGEDHKISDRHTDFWKTLKNWVENYEVIKNYKFLLLITTSNITPSSELIKWNDSTQLEKLAILNKIKDNKVTDSIKDFVNVIFNFNTDYTSGNLLEILSKFSINYSQPVIQDKIKEVLQHSFFKTIPKGNRLEFFNMLIGHIISIGRDNPLSWQIDISEFYNFVEYNTKHYSSNTQPIPDLYKNSSVDAEKFLEYSFVKDMKSVDLNSQIPNAINDYFRATSTVTHLQENDPLVSQNLSHYQDNVILSDINLLKAEIENEINDKSDIIQNAKHSRTCYLRAMQLPLKLVEGYNPNHDFFQRGTIHSLVNSNKNNFSWQYKKEENNGL